MERFLCIHGHFYQPPRENPWLEAVELQDSAYPYHDWNERVSAECYAPNSVARILDDQGHIARLVNNYAWMSFNFGPTLLAWMQDKAPGVYRAVLEADQQSREHFSGHGNALAQVYNHIIMPLANRRDKYTQALWGLRDFEHRFHRRPEGMWLAETAADLETLDVLAELGIRFTILSPSQAHRVRPGPDRDWEDVSGGRIDTTRAYLQRLPSGRSIALFFYNAAIERAINFERLLVSGEALVDRLMSGFSDARPGPQLVHVATDGESYGHRHPHGDMTLAYALDRISRDESVHLTNYGEFLEQHPAEWEVEIFENSSWSCPHGIERWRSDCGCNTGRAGWNQAWRQPLREALDWLRDTLAPAYEELAARYLKDPWAARDAAISIILDRSPDNIERFLAEHALRELDEEGRTTVLTLLELQRQALLMYTSCGWFSDELSDIQTTQVLEYAGRAIQLAELAFSQRPAATGQQRAGTRLGSSNGPMADGRKPITDLEEGFLQRLELARSNLPEHGNGRCVYKQFVRSARVGWEQVGAHYAISSLFESYPERARFFCYTADREAYHALSAGRAKLVLGRALIRSEITHEAARLSFGVLHFGDHHVNAGVRRFEGSATLPSPGRPGTDSGTGLTAEAFDALVHDASEAFRRGDFAEVIRVFDRNFGELTYSLRSLFRDEQRKVLKRVLHASTVEAENVFRQLHEHHLPTMHFLAGMGAPLPRAFEMAAEFLFNSDLRWDLKDELPDLEHIRNLFKEAETLHVRLDAAGLAYRLRKTLGRMADWLRVQPGNVPLLRSLNEVIELARDLPFEVDFWQPQNVYCELARTAFPDFLRQFEEGDRSADDWLGPFLQLGEKLGVRVTELQQQLTEVKSIPTPAELVHEVFAQRRVPGATYRIQFNQTFRFHDALEQAGYLHELGIRDLYASPILMARPGSAHGYDICDHTRLNPEIGGQEGFDALGAALRERGMGLLLDMVPNHMGIGDPNNRWWNDVLENGPASVSALWFDISWHPVNPNLENKLLLPILEDQYGTVLEAGKMRLAHESGSFVFYYYERRMPLDPTTYTLVLRPVLEQLVAALGEEKDSVRELKSILTALNYLPPRTETDAERLTERNREKEVIKDRIARLTEKAPEVAHAIEEVVRQFNGKVGEPHSFDLLDGLLAAQAFRPAYWRVAAEDINYRRFFDINELAAICVERPTVFEATHQLFFNLLAQGKATGLRIDHPDGLWDPTDYFRQLQEQYVLARIRARLAPRRPPEGLEEEVKKIIADCGSRIADCRNGEMLPHAADHASATVTPQSTNHNPQSGWPLYVVAEKILIEEEELPRAWTVDGTTGYDFLNLVNGLFVNASHGEAFERIHAQFTGKPLGFRVLVNSTKKMIMHVSMASEINSLAHQLDRISERNRRYRDFTLNSLTFVIREILACLPVYRTYVTGPGAVTARDRAFIEAAVEQAKQLNPRTAESIFDFVRDTLMLSKIEDFSEEDRPRLIEWAMRFQQLTGPITAKGVEDTALYVYNRLVSLNEVGGHPDHFGVSLEKFHRVNDERQRNWPHTLLASSTHDTKRSEDVRARLNVLSEVPGEWEDALSRWGKLNAPKKTVVDGQPAPDRNDEYLLYQTLLGAWPVEPLTAEGYQGFRERIAAYMHKATKEAKVHTSWVNANEEYDAAVRDFVWRVLPGSGPDLEDPFLVDLLELQRRVAFYGYFNSLAQVVLKCTCPGVPDFYQGMELWELSLVDPDNRRPVDYARRRDLLAGLKQSTAALGDDLTPLMGELLASLPDGRIKLYVTWRALACRQQHARLFDEGTYQPLEVDGAKKDHVCSFSRVLDGETVLIVVPRLLVGLMGGAERPPVGEAVWHDTSLLLPVEEKGRRYRNAFTAETFTVGERDGKPGLGLAEILGSFPVALLTRLAGG